MTILQLPFMPKYYDRYINYVEKNLSLIEALKKHNIKIYADELNILEKIGQKIYAPNKWTIAQIIRHIIDTEHVFLYRSLHIAKQPNATLLGFDQDVFMSHTTMQHSNLNLLLEEWKILRQSTIQLFESFNQNNLMHEGFIGDNKVSVLALGFCIVGHPLCHLEGIKQNYYSLV